MRCLCGHDNFMHQSSAPRRGVSDYRGKCQATRRLWFARPPIDHKATRRLWASVPPWFARSPIIRPGEDILDEKRAKELYNAMKPRDREYVMRRGYLYRPCECTTYHTVELGKVKLFGPTDMPKPKKQRKRETRG